MYIRRCAAVKYFAAAYLGAAIYCEWFVYFIQPAFWPKLRCRDETACTKILFIADPQIQGLYAERPPWNYLYAWDSDRYLKSTFQMAAGHLKPDVLVFLGDLMDEGSICTMPEFHGYTKRLMNIFELNYPFVQVWLPGDNDIGGENEPIKRDKIKEFNKVFEQPSVVTHRNISFYKVNGITHEYPNEADGDGDYKIVVSHFPVTIRNVFGNMVNNEIHPDIYFCAHEHSSKYVKQDTELAQRSTHWLKDDGEVLSVSPGEDKLYEVYVPTCSYRMGTNDIGYGAAVLDHYTRELRYTVFWSPRRFPYLYFYAIIASIALLFSLVFFTAKLLLCSSPRFTRQPKSWSNDKVPLLT